MPNHRWLLAAVLSLAPACALADEIRVAVASNFADAITTIARRFEESTGHEVTLILGSTGKHYAQIHNGAPFDAFFAADARHTEMLEKGGLAVRGSRFTYAVGRLVLWSPLEGYVDADGEVLASGGYRYLAIANPELAPYGRAARQVLEARGLWPALQRRMVRGENIGQAFQFVTSGNAELGFLALSQLHRPGESPRPGSYWEVPQELYTPIEQQAVLLTDTVATRSFMEFIRANEARSLIRDFGYSTP